MTPSHDGSKVSVASTVDAKPALRVFAVDGSTQPVVIDTYKKAALFVSFRPGDREITFRGTDLDGDNLVVAAADGSEYRQILSLPAGDGGFLSSDGTKIAYQTWDGRVSAIHVVDVDTGVDSVPVFDQPSDAGTDDYPQWSPDGTRFLFIRYQNGTVNHLMVAPSAGGPRVEIGPAMPNCGCSYLAAFSPDGTKVLAHFDADGSTWMLDPTGATAGTKLSSTIADAATWQRTAP